MTDESEQAPWLVSLEELHDQLEQEQYSKSIQLCQILLANQLPDTLQLIVVETLAKCHLQLDQYDKVTELNKKYKQQLPASLHAYSLYRLDEFDKSLAAVGTDHDDSLALHVLAQSLYRLNNAPASLEEYKELLENDDTTTTTSSMEEEDRLEVLTNALAVAIANSVPPGVVVSANGSSSSTAALVEQAEKELALLSSSSTTDYFYDLAYNLAIWQVLNGNNDSGSLFDLALEAARQQTDGDKAEVEPILVNQAWSSNAAYPTTLESPGPALVAKLNSPDIKKYASASPPLQALANLLQQRLYYYNRAVLAINKANNNNNKLSDAKDATQKLSQTCRKSKGNDTTSWWKTQAIILEAHVLHKQAKTKDALALLEKQLQVLSKEASSSSPVVHHAVASVVLHLCQLQSSTSNVDKLQMLQTHLPESFKSRAGVAAFIKCLSGSAGTGTVDENDFDALLAQGKYERAAALQEKESDTDSQVKYAQALSYFDPTKALEVWNELDLDNVPNLAPAMTGDELEALALPRVKHASKAAVTTTATTTTTTSKNRDAILRYRTRQREAHLKKLESEGKNINSLKPDPERWTPKYERSSSRRRRGGQQHRGAQGGVAERDAARLDVAARAAAAPTTTTHHVVVASSKRKGGKKKR